MRIEAQPDRNGRNVLVFDQPAQIGLDARTRSEAIQRDLLGHSDCTYLIRTCAGEVVEEDATTYIMTSTRFIVHLYDYLHCEDHFQGGGNGAFGSGLVHLPFSAKAASALALISSSVMVLIPELLLLDCCNSNVGRGKPLPPPPLLGSRADLIECTLAGGGELGWISGGEVIGGRLPAFCR